MPTRRLMLAAPLLALFALPARAANQGSQRLSDGQTEITGFLDRIERQGDMNILLVNAGGENWTVEYPDPPANANDSPVDLALSQGMVLSIRGHQAADTAYRMRATMIIIDGTQYRL
ncbi:MAG: hypothetical protein AAGF79_18210 [Pseudomonadota bacterium]